MNADDITRLLLKVPHWQRLERLVTDLDAELDGVNIPREAASYMNAIRKVLQDIDWQDGLGDEEIEGE